MMPSKGPEFKTPQVITCCRNCVAPKRHTACWGHCPDYQKERAEYDAKQEERRKKERIDFGLKAQRYASVKRAQRGGNKHAK